jgi:hypothetical protein
MKPTKRQSDPLGRSTTRHRYSRYLLSLAIAITGSVWPIQARSIEPIFDRGARRARPKCWLEVFRRLGASESRRRTRECVARGSCCW